MNIQTKIITAKALRTTFNQTQRSLLTDTFWDDDKLLEMVKEMQEQHKVFQSLCEEIREENQEEYEKQILGL